MRNSIWAWVAGCAATMISSTAVQIWNRSSVYTRIGLPWRERNCLLTGAPIRSPNPAAGMITLVNIVTHFCAGIINLPKYSITKLKRGNTFGRRMMLKTMTPIDKRSNHDERGQPK